MTTASLDLDKAIKAVETLVKEYEKEYKYDNRRRNAYEHALKASHELQALKHLEEISKK